MVDGIPTDVVFALKDCCHMWDKFRYMGILSEHISMMTDYDNRFGFIPSLFRSMQVSDDQQVFFSSWNIWKLDTVHFK